MAIAFASFDEPHAWIIRGLVEYGWSDQTRSTTPPPAGSVGSFDLTAFPDSAGASGVTLEFAAYADGEWCHEDGTYHFEVVLTRLSTGQTGFVVRCPEANFFQEFEYDRDNPMWAAGYIHQALSTYVPEFVRWRLGGGQLDWATRAGIPEAEGETCSPALAGFVGDVLRRNQRFDTGPEEGWWLDGAGSASQGGAAAPIATAGAGLAQGPGAAAPPPTPTPAASPVSPKKWSGPIATAGTGGGDPVYLSAAARARQANAPLPGGGNQALARTAAPGLALMITSGLGLTQSLCWVANAAVTLNRYWVKNTPFYEQDTIFAVFFSVVLAGVLFFGSLASGVGAWQYRQANGTFMPLVAIAFAALTPGCCIGGIPVAVWAFMRWRDPMVVAARG